VDEQPAVVAADDLAPDRKVRRDDGDRARHVLEELGRVGLDVVLDGLEEDEADARRLEQGDDLVAILPPRQLDLDRSGPLADLRGQGVSDWSGEDELDRTALPDDARRIGHDEAADDLGETPDVGDQGRTSIVGLPGWLAE